MTRDERKALRRKRLLDLADAPRAARQPDGIRYLIITQADAEEIFDCLWGSPVHSPALDRLFSRLICYADIPHDIGAPIDEIVQALKYQDICPACGNEDQERDCVAIQSRKLGRRLARLLEIARGERKPWDGQRTDIHRKVASRG
jgi:hypothetical protein